MTIVLPTWVRMGVLGAFVGFTTIYAVLVTFVFPHATVSAAVGLVVFLVGALAGSPRPGAALTIPRTIVLVASGLAVPWIGSIGLDPAGSLTTGAWFISGVASAAVLLMMHRRLVLAGVVLAGYVVQTLLWAGPDGLLRFLVILVILVLGLIACTGIAVGRAGADLAAASTAERATAELRVAEDAYQSQRETRLVTTKELADAMLLRIAEGALTPEDRVECRVLHQTIRDEIRGRRLLNDAVRQQVLAHRRRGAVVQVHDDGDLDDLDPAVLDSLLTRVASALVGVPSDLIVIRSLGADSPTAISVVATSTDPEAAALGLDDDGTVDVWLELDRAAPVTV